MTIIYFVQVKSIEETCYAESLLLVDACASFRDSLYTDCRLFDEQVGALFSMFMSILFSLIFVNKLLV